MVRKPQAGRSSFVSATDYESAPAQTDAASDTSRQCHPDSLPSGDVDLVIIGFSGERRALELLARSLRLYADPDLFGRIYIVLNDPAIRRFRWAIKKRVLPEFGTLAGRVVLVDPCTIVDRPNVKNGWRSQQALKLLMARMVKAPQFLVLDTKNHFIRPVGRDAMIAADGRLLTHMYSLNRHFVGHFETACRYFGVEDVDTSAHAMPTTTPFVMSTSVVRELLEVVERREDKPFFDFFMKNTELTEFYFYYAYILSAPGRFEALYKIRSTPNLTLFRIDARSVERISAMLPILDQPDVYCFGVHRLVFEVGIPESRQRAGEVWQRFGLIKNEKELVYFQTFDKPFATGWLRRLRKRLLNERSRQYLKRLWRSGPRRVVRRAWKRILKLPVFFSRR